MSRDEKTNELITTRNVEFTCKKERNTWLWKIFVNLQAIVRIKTCCRVSENFVRNFVFLCICCNFRLSILGFLVSAGHAFVKIRPLLLSTFYKTRNETRWLMGNIIYIYISLQRARQNFPVKCLWKKNTKHIYHKWPRKHPGRLFNFRGPSEGV